jgi:hypothetical protein
VSAKRPITHAPIGRMTKPTAKIAAVLRSCAVGSALREKDGREIDGEGGIGEPVIPFDQIAQRSADDRNQPFARYR